jgi:hypothetical protein
MAKLTNNSVSGTSFHDTTIKTTLGKLIEVLGEPQCFQNDGEGKTNVDFDCETESGDIFTIYDWKEYRPIGLDETIEFHIGGFNVNTTRQAKSELLDLLSK